MQVAVPFGNRRGQLSVLVPLSKIIKRLVSAGQFELAANSPWTAVILRIMKPEMTVAQYLRKALSHSISTEVNSLIIGQARTPMDKLTVEQAAQFIPLLS